MAKYFFSAGPAPLPEPVTRSIREGARDPFGTGTSIFEVSHRSREFLEFLDAARVRARRVLGVPDSHALFFSPFAATHHFSLLVGNLSLPGDTVAYGDTGVWAAKAIAAARAQGRAVHIVDGGRCAAGGYRSLGGLADWDIPSGTRYLHLTVNNTVYGTEYPRIPSGFGVPLVLDMTSSLASRADIPWAEVGLIYASAQKNLGVAGASIVVIRRDLLAMCSANAASNRLTEIMSYASLSDGGMLNTPPVFAYWAMDKMISWIGASGGVAAMEERATIFASTVYGALDGGFYRVRPEEGCRSRHNYVFATPTETMDERFITEAEACGLLDLGGYRGVGGMRASAYNGQNDAAVVALAHFIHGFRIKYG